MNKNVRVMYGFSNRYVNFLISFYELLEIIGGMCEDVTFWKSIC